VFLVLRTKLPLWSTCVAAALVASSSLTVAHAAPSRILPAAGIRGHERLLAVPKTLARSEVVREAGSTRAPFTVTHVGFSWRGAEGTGVRFRTVSESGERSEWAAAPEAHDLEHGDHHYSGVIAVRDAAAVQVRDIARDGVWMGPVKVDLLNTVDGPTEFVATPRAEAGPNGPDIVTRAEWGADESLKRTKGGCTRSFWRVQQLFVHHTAGTNNDPDPAATMRGIYWYHTKTRGWCDIGYNFVIGPEGSIFEGRWARKYLPWESHTSEDTQGRAVAGAHVADFNSGSVGISMMGDFSDAGPSAAARSSLVEMLAWEASRHDLRPKAWHRYRNPDSGLTKRLRYISGHRDAGDTACPGARLYGSLSEIRGDVADRMETGRDDSKVTLRTDRKEIRYSEPVTLSGTLEDGSGGALAAKEVVVWARKSGGGWRRAGRPMTGADGSYSLQLAPRYTTKFVAVYPGDAGHWESQSGDRTVRVEATVLLQAEGGLPDVVGVHHFPPGTTSIVFTGSVAPEHPDERVTVRALRVESDGSETLVRKARRRLNASSEYSYSFAPPETGTTYRLITWFSGDGNARSNSESVYVVVDG
jgi:hypothetical protein